MSWALRYLAIDLGDKRTGLAVGDDTLRLATPAGVVNVSIKIEDGEALLRELCGVVEEHLGPGDGVVFGLPINMDGSEGARARLVRGFAGRLGERAGRVVEFQDERLTSVQADWQMGQSGLTHAQKKARRDALAAMAILQDFLDGMEPPAADEG